MSLENTRDGAPPRVVSGNGVPLGPRVKRPGWSGWFLTAPDGSLVPDGHVEPIDPNARRAKHPRTPPPPRERCRYGHGPEDQHINSQGWLACRECAREARRRSRQAKKAA